MDTGRCRESEVNNTAIFFISSGNTFYFEQSDKGNDNPSIYLPKSFEKETIRKDWFDIIIWSLHEIDYHFDFKEDYDRYKEIE